MEARHGPVAGERHGGTPGPDVQQPESDHGRVHADGARPHHDLRHRGRRAAPPGAGAEPGDGLWTGRQPDRHHARSAERAAQRVRDRRPRRGRADGALGAAGTRQRRRGDRLSGGVARGGVGRRVPDGRRRRGRPAARRVGQPRRALRSDGQGREPVRDDRRRRDRRRVRVRRRAAGRVDAVARHAVSAVGPRRRAPLRGGGGARRGRRHGHADRARRRGGDRRERNGGGERAAERPHRPERGRQHHHGCGRRAGRPLDRDLRDHRDPRAAAGRRAADRVDAVGGDARSGVRVRGDRLRGGGAAERGERAGDAARRRRADHHGAPARRPGGGGGQRRGQRADRPAGRREHHRGGGERRGTDAHLHGDRDPRRPAGGAGEPGRAAQRGLAGGGLGPARVGRQRAGQRLPGGLEGLRDGVLLSRARRVGGRRPGAERAHRGARRRPLRGDGSGGERLRRRAAAADHRPRGRRRNGRGRHGAAGAAARGGRGARRPAAGGELAGAGRRRHRRLRGAVAHGRRRPPRRMAGRRQ